jgi:hypothetical protein
MAAAFTYARKIADRSADGLRFALVSGCAIALIAAGQALPL